MTLEKNLDDSRVRLLKLDLVNERDVVSARQAARKICERLGFDEQDQVRIATVASELARNAFRYAKSGQVEYAFDVDSTPQAFVICVSDKGPGIPHLDDVLSGSYESKTGMGMGLVGSRRLMDQFKIDTEVGRGTSVFVAKALPARARSLDRAQLHAIIGELDQSRGQTAYDEVHRQNRELMLTMDQLRTNQEELQELNRELSETNRGVVALYAELDEKANALQRANEVKTSFLSNMTHEFRTPLSSIISLSRLLLDRIDGELSEEQERQVKYIRQSTQGLLELVNDLLDLAKVEAGKISIKTESIDCAEFLLGLRGVMRPLMGPDPVIELKFSSPPDAGSMETDEGKVAQVLRNLVSNALKYTERGEVEVGVRATDDESILFFVRDTGIGIDEADLELIFQDFTQIDSKLQKRAKGTGLGLPLSRKLARLLGGDVWAESEPGLGSTFYLRLPRIYKGPSEGTLLSGAST